MLRQPRDEFLVCRLVHQRRELLGRAELELEEPALAHRVGILPDGRAPAREHTEITDGANRIGEITSGGFGPTVGGPIAMGYVATAHAAPGTALSLVVRGTPRPARIVRLPFFAPRYYRGK